MGIELTDTFMTLKPRNIWKKAMSQAELTTLIEHYLRDMRGRSWRICSRLKCGSMK